MATFPVEASCLPPARARRGGPLGLYVHIPFCVRKCHYCDFHSGPVRPVSRRRYLEALGSEIESSAFRGEPVRTVFFGGGTPSELTPGELSELVSRIRDSFRVRAGAEWTLECNPGTLTSDLLGRVRALGIDRISLGVQSFQDAHLRLLGRIHDAEAAREAYRLVRDGGFENVNLDLIFGLPEQTPQQWREDLEEALEMAPEHFSLYHLTIEKGTEFGRRRALGLLPLPNEEAAAAMFETAMDLTRSAGYRQYEISSYALPGRECLHNRIYWRNEPFVGVGLGAASYVDGLRWSNASGFQEYIEGARRGCVPRGSEERLSPEAALGEEMMLRLRTSEGAVLSELSTRYGICVESRFRDVLRLLGREGLISHDGDRVRLTRRGKLLADSVCLEFLT